jgi:hypothetical protein
MIDGLSVLNPNFFSGIRLNMDNIQYVSGRTSLNDVDQSQTTHPNLGSVLKSHHFE